MNIQENISKNCSSCLNVKCHKISKAIWYQLIWSSNHPRTLLAAMKIVGKTFNFQFVTVFGVSLACRPYVSHRHINKRGWMLYYTLGKKVVTPQNEVSPWQSFIFYLFLRSEGRLVGRIYVFYAFQAISCLMRFFGKFVMTFIDIGEIGCMDLPKCHWVVIVVNLVKHIWFFAWCSLYVWFSVCWVSIGIPASSCDNRL